MYSHCNFNCQIVTGLDAACNAAGRTLKVEFIWGRCLLFLMRAELELKKMASRLHNNSHYQI